MIKAFKQLQVLRQSLMQNVAMLDDECMLCRQPCEYKWLQKSIHLCSFCRPEIQAIEPACDMCSESILNSVVDGPMLCGDCLKSSKHYDHTVCIGSYAAWLRSMVLRYKRAKQLNLSVTFAGLLAQRLTGFARFVKPEDWLVVSVPCSIQTYRQNKYDPSQQIAQQLAVILNLPYKNILQRKFWFARRQQKDLTNQQRLALPSDQYAIKSRFVKQSNQVLRQRSILLIDDVITTGATVNLCSEKLKQAGAAKIVVSAIARATSSVANSDTNIVKRIADQD